jgi:hypothetical protein
MVWLGVAACCAARLVLLMMNELWCSSDGSVWLGVAACCAAQLVLLITSAALHNRTLLCMARLLRGACRQHHGALALHGLPTFEVSLLESMHSTHQSPGTSL